MQLIDKVGGPEGIRTLDLFHAMEAEGNNLRMVSLKTNSLDLRQVAGSGTETVVVRTSVTHNPPHP